MFRQDRGVRLFVAVPLAETVRNRLLALQSRIVGMRWCARETMHVTLQFIGSVEQNRVPAIRQALKSIQADSFTLEMYRVGCFARSGQGVLWAGLKDSSALQSLHAAVVEALSPLCSLKAENRYVPHITLGRTRMLDAQALRTLAVSKTAEFGASVAFPVESFVLFKSDLRPGGPLYTPIECFSLQTETLPRS